MCCACHALQNGLAQMRISASHLLVTTHTSGRTALSADVYAACKMSGRPKRNPQSLSSPELRASLSQRPDEKRGRRHPQ
eukprot:11453016-Alexandrium_andersonii.AAC.1